MPAALLPMLGRPILAPPLDWRRCMNLSDMIFEPGARAPWVGVDMVCLQAPDGEERVGVCGREMCSPRAPDGLPESIIRRAHP